MHAVTRYGLECGDLILLLITLVWIALTFAYARSGLLCSMFAHATYNALVPLAVEPLQLVTTAATLIAFAAAILAKDRVAVL